MSEQGFVKIAVESPYAPVFVRRRLEAFDNGQLLFRFPNGYGASVIYGVGTYGWHEGLFELAVLWWESNNRYFLVYDTPITNDVLGYLTPEDVLAAIEYIAVLATPPIPPVPRHAEFVTKLNN